MKTGKIEKAKIMSDYNNRIDEKRIPCHCDKCGNLWWYGGDKNNDERISCSNCKYKQKLTDMRIDYSNNDK